MAVGMASGVPPGVGWATCGVFPRATTSPPAPPARLCHARGNHPPRRRANACPRQAEPSVAAAAAATRCHALGRLQRQRWRERSSTASHTHGTRPLAPLPPRRRWRGPVVAGLRPPTAPAPPHSRPPGRRRPQKRPSWRMLIAEPPSPSLPSRGRGAASRWEPGKRRQRATPARAAAAAAAAVAGGAGVAEAEEAVRSEPATVA